MADFQDKPNTGVLFPNKKEKENQPDYKGHIFDVNLKKWDVAVWEKTSKSGNRFLSVSIKEPFKKNEQGQTLHPEPKGNTSNDLPF